MQLAIFYLLLGALLAVSLPRPGRGEAQLQITNLTKNVAELVYTDPSSGLGLRVASAPDSLYLSSLDGRSFVAAGEAGGSLRLISLGRSMFIQEKSSTGKSRDFAVPDAYTGILSNADQAVLQDLVHILNASGMTQDSDSRLWDALLTILNCPEVELLQSAVAALGSTGVTGVEYPSVLPFYMAALRLDQLVQRSNLTSGSSRFPERARELMDNGLTDDCLSECPPCPYQECLGLCGYSCNCWKWVCGDCCYHLGCYDHDICCREKFVRTACLFPFNFKCEYNYSCN